MVSKSGIGVGGIYLCMDCSVKFRVPTGPAQCLDCGSRGEDTVPIYIEDNPELEPFFVRTDYLGG